MKKALITGITGQDGSYLAEILLDKNYEVHGMMRRKAQVDYGNSKHISDRIIFHYGNLIDSFSIMNIVREVRPDEIYNLAAQSFVGTAWQTPYSTTDANAVGVLNILEAIRILDPEVRFYQASTSEMFGKVVEVPQSESTPFYPRSPYAVAKLYGHWITVNYRESYNLFCSSGILFNHESERRGSEFVTRKISMGAAEISKGLRESIQLGNINAKRDWGHSRDYVRAMWLMMNQESPDDYVIASGNTHTVREFVEKSFLMIGKEIVWDGEGLNERGIDRKTGKILVSIDSEFFRPSEVDILHGDSSKAKSKLGWKPEISFDRLVELMVTHDLELLK